MIKQKVKCSIQLKYKVVSKTLTLYWKRELEVDVMNYGFISVLVCMKNTEKTLNRYPASITNINILVAVNFQ